MSKLKEKAAVRGKRFSPVMIMTDLKSGIVPSIKSEVSTIHYNQELHQTSLHSYLVFRITTSRMLFPFLSGSLMSRSDRYAEKEWHWF